MYLFDFKELQVGDCCMLLGMVWVKVDVYVDESGNSCQVTDLEQASWQAEGFEQNRDRVRIVN